MGSPGSMSDHGEQGRSLGQRRSFTPEFKAEIVELCQRGTGHVRHAGNPESTAELRFKGVMVIPTGLRVAWRTGLRQAIRPWPRSS
jgi:transposase-like protein